jgi:hypothetical protein
LHPCVKRNTFYSYKINSEKYKRYHCYHYKRKSCIHNKGNNYTGIIATNVKIKITNGSGVTELIVVVKGDTSGDGVINALDLLQVQKSILNTYDFNDVQKLAGDTSGDNNINALDLLQVQKSILNTFEIKQ